ncbi:hypothetical protein HY969_00845 [Candidatus Kaiserbacteria bacterium]|nr:hypothetical protein [Candidatus Kaiserbacteria bacterium]
MIKEYTERLRLRDAYASMHEPESLRRLADFYWHVVVIVGTLLMLGSVGYGMWLFFVEPTRAESSVTVGARSEVFDRAELQKAVQALEKRQENFDALLK